MFFADREGTTALRPLCSGRQRHEAVRQGAQNIVFKTCRGRPPLFKLDRASQTFEIFISLPSAERWAGKQSFETH